MTPEHFTQNMLDELAREDESLLAPAHVEERVMAAVRARHSGHSRRWFGIAAALVLGMSISLLAPAPEFHAAKAPETFGREIATGYYPLRAGPLLDRGELGQVVRMSVPRRELYRHGFELMGNGGTETVRADVLVGMDGTARAIRFVH